MARGCERKINTTVQPPPTNPNFHCCCILTICSPTFSGLSLVVPVPRGSESALRASVMEAPGNELARPLICLGWAVQCGRSLATTGLVQDRTTTDSGNRFRRNRSRFHGVLACSKRSIFRLSCAQWLRVGYYNPQQHFAVLILFTPRRTFAAIIRMNQDRSPGTQVCTHRRDPK
jgi:hypothetical protein